jgi:hypothetical protein
MGKLIIPKTYIKDLDLPLIFLAGPIKSAPLWQDKAIEFIFSQTDKVIIASPRRGIRESLAKYIISGDENYFPRQRAWERHYLYISGIEKAKKGCVMFWLPGESNHDCKKSYAAMTRFELAQLSTHYSHDKSTRFCIGSDGKFSELDTIKYDLSLDAPDKPIFPTLEETCLEAIRIAN